MNVQVFSTYEELSKQAAEDITQLLSHKETPLVCMASGDSPAGLYREIVKRVKEKKLDISHWYFVGLDEWMGMNENDEGSCRFHLNNQFFNPLQISNERICFFDGKAIDVNEECKRTENFVSKHKGIDVVILGLGLNGHIGMNEPGTSPNLHSHVAEIHPTTQQAGQKYFTKPQQLSQGLTLGIATIMEAKNILLIVNGAHKSKIVQQVLQGEISEQVPASLLRKHAGLKVYLDSSAAQLLSDE
jgi:galactosamine-6-phosphate isomerase